MIIHIIGEVIVREDIRSPVGQTLQPVYQQAEAPPILS